LLDWMESLTDERFIPLTRRKHTNKLWNVFMHDDIFHPKALRK
jgi:hypothetical protein